MPAVLSKSTARSSETAIIQKCPQRADWQSDSRVPARELSSKPRSCEGGDEPPFQRTKGFDHAGFHPIRLGRPWFERYADRNTGWRSTLARCLFERGHRRDGA